MMFPAESSVTPGISLLPRLRGPIPDRNNRFPTRFACGNAPTGSGARVLSKELLISLRCSEEFLQQRPIIFSPAFGQVIVQAVGKTDVIEYQVRSRTLRPEFESGDGVSTFGPGNDSPGLDDSLVRDQLQIPPNNMSFEQRECAADL